MRLVFLILCLLPAFAHAEEVVGAAMLVAAAFAGPIGLSAWAAAALAFAGSMIYGSAQQKKAQRQAEEQERARREAYNGALQDRTVTTVNAAQPFRYVYGRARVGSAIVAILTSGDRDQFKHLVCVHAAHECDAFEEIYVGGKALGTLDAQGRVTGGDYYKTVSAYFTSGWQNGPSFTLPEGFDPASIIVSYGTVDASGDFGGALPAATYSISGNVLTPTSGFAPWFVECQYTQNTSTVRVQKHLGTPTDPVDAYLNSILPAKWPATAVLRGFTYTVVTLDLNQPEFQGGIPDIEVLLRGKKLYDVRTGTTAWSQNNALVIYDYLTSDMCGVPVSDLPLADFIAAANVCDESTVYGARYTFNGDVTADQSPQKVLEKMAQSMAGGIVSTTWSIWAGKYVAPVMALQQSDIVGAIAITPGVADADLYNGVRGQFISSENGYVATDFKPYQNSAYVTADGGELWTDIDFPYTDRTQRVHNLARIYTEDQRNGFTVKAEFSLKAWDRKVGERVTLTSAFYGWSSKVFRITDKSYSPRSAVSLTLKEDAASIWDLQDAVTVDSTPNSDLPNPFFLEALTGLACTSGTAALQLQADGTVVSRILAQWSAPTSQSVFTNGEVEIQWKKVGDDVWQKDSVAGDVTQRYLAPVEDGATYVVRVRAVGTFLNVKSDWTYQSVVVVGKTEPPSDVTSFSINSDGVATWTPVTDADVRAGGGYKLRWHQGSNTSWGDAAALHDGILTESPYQVLIRPVGPATFMIKAVDSSGNESANTSFVITSLGDPPIENIVITNDFKALGWPGSYTGAAVSGGNLAAIADASPLAWDPNEDTAGWTFDTAAAWTAITYGPVEYISDVLVVAPADVGSQLTLSTAISGTAYLIEYRRDGDAPGWTTDAEPGWTSDSAAAWTTPDDWKPWPGALTAAAGRYQWRVTIQSRDVQGVISAFAAVLDVTDQVEIVGQVAISSAGTAIPTTKTWRAIKAIHLSLVSDGGTARTMRIENRDARLVTARDINDLPVNGTALATIEGY